MLRKCPCTPHKNPEHPSKRNFQVLTKRKKKKEKERDRVVFIRQGLNKTTSKTCLGTYFFVQLCIRRASGTLSSSVAHLKK